MKGLMLQCIKIDTKEFELFAPQPQSTQGDSSVQSADRYWSKIWPASIALSRFLLSHTHLVTNKTVLELGAGLGLPSFTAAAFAQHVYCSDQAVDAMNAVAATIDHNKITNISCAVYSWQQLNEFPKVDVLLLSDVAYNPENFDSLYALIKQFLERNTKVIISTPQRLSAKTFMLKLMEWCTLQEEYIIDENGIEVYTSVFLLQKSAVSML